jgi:hypothetical protein
MIDRLASLPIFPTLAICFCLAAAMCVGALERLPT